MNKKNKKYLTILVSFIFVCMIIGISFAYIGKANFNNSVNVNGSVSAATPYYWRIEGSGDITLSTMSSTLSSSNVGAFSSETFSKSIQLITNTQKQVTCTYDITYTPTIKYTPTLANTLEFTIQGTTDDGSLNLSEVNLPSVDVGNSYSLGKYAIIASGNSSKKQTWQFEIRFYNIDADQSEVTSTKPAGSLEFAEGDCS